MNKKGQLAIIIILAIIIVGIVVTYLLVRENIIVGGVPAEFQPVYASYSACIEDKARAALDLAGTQGGHIYLEPFIPGSDYAPFSSQLNFMGFGVPYWFYESGNGVLKEQVPAKTQIEQEIAQYVEERIADCNFEQFYSQGFSITFGEPKAAVSIQDTQVNVNVNAQISASLEDSSAVKSTHEIIIQSKFGKFYNIALETYNKEKSESFLEDRKSVV